MPNRIDHEVDPVAKRETLELVRAYYGITDLKVRQKLTAIVRVAALE